MLAGSVLKLVAAQFWRLVSSASGAVLASVTELILVQAKLANDSIWASILTNLAFVSIAGLFGFIGGVPAVISRVTQQITKSKKKRF